MPDYQLKVSRHLQFLPLLGVAAAVVGGLLFAQGQRLPAIVLLVVAFLIGMLQFALSMILNRSGRERARRQMIAAVDWRGSEQVLDVGCGNGIILLAAAQKLTPGQGKAMGIDIWVEGSGEQNARNLRTNAVLEGVADRVELQEVDARQMPFADASFDVIFASLSLHHMGNSADRQRATREMLRVLRPGGTILIYDAWPIANAAAQTLRDLGAGDVQRLGGFFVRTLRIRRSDAARV